MRAVNLIPADQRRGGGGGTPWASYSVIGALAVALVAVTTLVLTSNQIASRKGKLERLDAQATAAQAQAQRLQPYVTFAQLASQRANTVAQLAGQRFDWSTVLADLDRVVGSDVWLTGLTGTAAPGAGGSLSSGSGSASSLRTSLPNPAVELQGCATSHDAVVAFVSRLRASRGVIRVSLADDEKPDNQSGGSGASSGGSSTTCGKDAWPSFSLVVFYKELPGGVPAGTNGSTGSTTGAAPASGSSSSSGSSGTTSSGSSSSSSSGGSSSSSSSGSTGGSSSSTPAGSTGSSSGGTP